MGTVHQKSYLDSKTYITFSSIMSDMSIGSKPQLPCTIETRIADPGGGGDPDPDPDPALKIEQVPDLDSNFR